MPCLERDFTSFHIFAFCTKMGTDTINTGDKNEMNINKAEGQHVKVIAHLRSKCSFLTFICLWIRKVPEGAKSLGTQCPNFQLKVLL